jgi:hypothetical protein
MLLEVALPLTSVTAPPNAFPSIANCTLPVGVPVPLPVTATAAVQLTLCPYAVVLLGLATTLVAVLAAPTSWVTLPVLAL